MEDLTIELEDRPGALAGMGEALGKAGVSIEGGGASVQGGIGIAHFLFEDGKAARTALEAAGIRVVEQRPVLAQRLAQEAPGQLGSLTRQMADAGVNIETLYSDHDHRLILTVDDLERGRVVSEGWERERLERDRSVRAADDGRKQHDYSVHLAWTGNQDAAGNQGAGTTSYQSYKRDFEIAVLGKPALPGSSDPSFRGDPSRYNPEELLVASLSSCHMLWYLHLCAAKGVVVLRYEDNASGVMRENSTGSGVFTGVRLAPEVLLSNAAAIEDALQLHEAAHAMCFIANSVNFPIELAPRVSAAAFAVESPAILAKAAPARG